MFNYSLAGTKDDEGMKSRNWNTSRYTCNYTKGIAHFRYLSGLKHFVAFTQDGGSIAKNTLYFIVISYYLSHKPAAPISAAFSPRADTTKVGSEPAALSFAWQDGKNKLAARAIFPPSTTRSGITE